MNDSETIILTKDNENIRGSLELLTLSQAREKYEDLLYVTCFNNINNDTFGVVIPADCKYIFKLLSYQGFSLK